MKFNQNHRAKTAWVLGPYHIASCARILFVVALLLADTALAQTADKTKEDSGKSFLNSYDGINKARGLAFKCIEVNAHIKKLEDQLQAWKTVNDKFLTPLGNALTVAKASTEMYKGQPIQGTQTAVMALLDIRVCNALKLIPEGGLALCAAWKAGRAAGYFIDKAPQWFGWTDATLNEIWTDFLADTWTDLLTSLQYRDPTPADFQRFYDLAQQKQHALQARMESQQREKVRCEATDDATDGGIQKALDAALARARQRSSAIPRESDTTAGGLSDAGPALPSFEIEPRRGDSMPMAPVLTMPSAVVKQPRQRPTPPTAGAVGSATGSSPSHPTPTPKGPEAANPRCRHPEIACSGSSCSKPYFSLPVCK